MTGCLVSGAMATLALWSCTAQDATERNLVTTVETHPGPTDEEDGNPVRKDTCSAARHAWMAGRPIKEIDASDLPRPVRVYTAGSPITMDYQPERMNVVVGADGHVVDVKCG